MSNAIRYDSLLTRDLAAELHATLSGARLAAVLLDRDRLRAALVTRARRRADPHPPSLLWQLHPDAGHITRIPADGGSGARVPLRGAPVVVGVDAPPDERIITLHLAAEEGAAGAPSRIVIELVTNQWNALAVGDDGRIVSVLRERQTRERTLRPGQPYVPPARSSRAWSAAPPSLDEWSATLLGAEAGRRMAALLRHAAYVSPLNVAAILGGADVSDGTAALEGSWQRYVALAWEAPRSPVLLVLDGRRQPYAVTLAGTDGEPAASLLDAFEAAARAADAVPAPVDRREQALDAVAERIAALTTRLQRLEGERAGAEEEAASLRHGADLLLSQLHRVPRGAAEASLDDYAGGTVRVALDATLGPAENANRLYDAARKRSRAASRIPRLQESARQEIERLSALLARIREGAVEPAELARLARRRSAAAAGRDAAPALPYRLYRTSGGLEVRVGRGARANDALTFRHSSPSDVWLHARDVGGAHVILRWARQDQNPSGRDLEEAAVLAALHSRARTSGLVAVDWTRRKYVRKPRRAAPGLVLPERVRTLFVEPDAALEERLRADD